MQPHLKQLVESLQKSHPSSAIGAFNINDMTDMHGVMYAAAHLRTPCILMASTSCVKYMGIHFAREMFRAAQMTIDVPLYLMLDHATDVDVCARCIENGFSIVMFDGSALPFQENVRRTQEVVRRAHAAGTLVEGEIGRLPGREETLNVSETDALCTDPEEAKAFWEQTGVDLLAISFGTAHGFYKSAPRLRFDLISRTYELTHAPLVMHGGTGVPDDDVRKAILHGVKKVNIGTEVKHAYSSALKEYAAALKDEVDPRAILMHAKEAVQRAVEGRLGVLNTPSVTNGE